MKHYVHQQKIISEDPLKTGLWLGTGSGKTRIALMLARGRTLVIAPKTQVEDRNWEREHQQLIFNSQQSNVYYPIENVDITVISKETFRRDGHNLAAYETVIVDETHTCLGVTPNVRWIKKQAIPKTSLLFEELQKYIVRTSPSRIYLCTATIDRSPMTVWGAATILGYNWNWYKFRDTFYVKLPMPGREVWTPKKDNETKNRLAKAVQKIGYTGRLSDYFDVPEQTYKTDYIELSSQQKDWLKLLPLQFPDPLVLLGKKHQVENGILNGDQFNPHHYFDNGKIDKILDYAHEFPQMVVFAKYLGQIEQIATALRGISKKVYVLSGDTKDRGTMISVANNNPDCVFIAQVQISAGYELPNFPVMIFASSSYSVVDRIQGEGRILRANALKKNLYIDLVVRGGIDEAVYKSIKDKKDFNERIYLNL